MNGPGSLVNWIGRRFCLIALITCVLAASCTAVESQTSNSPVTITVSAAASLEDVLLAIAPTFTTTHPDISVDYNFAASGALQRQIEQGAPVDVFFSAAVQQMDALDEKDLVVAASRQEIVTNSLVLIAPQSSSLDITSLDQLKAADIDHFAVGEFRSVPAGQYAEQVLKNLDVLNALESKFVFGNTVRSVLSAVSTGSADVGMVYATDAALSEQVKVLATAPAGAHETITYPTAVVQASTQPESAQTFIDFLKTEPAQMTFTEFGFAPV
ncbi:MAG: molybdate ABC transporter substrate-binding protein [Cyanobacteria bacterium P01_D01_bin.14]